MKKDFVEILCALSYATSLGFGGHIEHGLRTAFIALEIADSLTVTEVEYEAIFYGSLLKDIACTACSAGVAAFLPGNKRAHLHEVILVDPSRIGNMMRWLSRYFTLDASFLQCICRLMSFVLQCGTVSPETMRSHCEIAMLFARDLGFPVYVQETLHFQLERWDGRGMAYKVKAQDIPLPSRILHIAQVIELTSQFFGFDKTRIFIEKNRASRFDPEVVDVFLELEREPTFWSRFAKHSTQDALLNRCPSTVAPLLQGQTLIERICEILAGFIDLRMDLNTRNPLHHSRTVADIAYKMGIALKMDRHELINLKCAALVHDIGYLAIPATILRKKETLTRGEVETLRLHPYYTQWILEQSALHELAEAASSDHEWINGTGYYRRLKGEQIPFHGRILAVANYYVRHSQQQEDRDVLHQMQALVNVRFDPVCYQALLSSLNIPSQRIRIRRSDDLTTREIEVLVHLARGNTAIQIAKLLHISKKTVDHHLSHIYQKIGVSSRTAAVVYAVQRGLV
jgi:HD-GYP domain-containing protein (c-di-GMP phosphodiesterase class II)